MTSPCKHIYKITYPNGKIYVGSDVRADIDKNYCGSPSAVAEIANDLGIEPTQVPRGSYPLAPIITTTDGGPLTIRIPHLNIVLRKEILWESQTASNVTVRKLEMEFIRENGANNPAIGYNKLPKYRMPELHSQS